MRFTLHMNALQHTSIEDMPKGRNTCNRGGEVQAGELYGKEGDPESLHHGARRSLSGTDLM